MTNLVDRKICANVNCTQENPQPLSKFSRNRANKDKYQSWCKACLKVRTAQWAKEHPERLKQLQTEWIEKNKDHVRELQRIWRAENEERRKAQHQGWYNEHGRDLIRRGKLLRLYNLTLEQYDARFAAQRGVCAICGEPEKNIDPRTGKSKALAVDHCHTTGVCRGLLCAACNQGIGLFRDNPKLLATAIAYLEATDEAA